MSRLIHTSNKILSIAIPLLLVIIRTDISFALEAKDLTLVYSYKKTCTFTFDGQTRTTTQAAQSRIAMARSGSLYMFHDNLASEQNSSSGVRLNIYKPTTGSRPYVNELGRRGELKYRGIAKLTKVGFRTQVDSSGIVYLGNNRAIAKASGASEITIDEKSNTCGGQSYTNAKYTEELSGKIKSEGSCQFQLTECRMINGFQPN